MLRYDDRRLKWEIYRISAAGVRYAASAMSYFAPSSQALKARRDDETPQTRRCDKIPGDAAHPR